MKTNDLMAWARAGGASVHVATQGDHNAKARVERPIRTVTEGSRTIVSHGNGSNTLLWPTGCIATVQALRVLPPKRAMRVKPREGEPPIPRPRTPLEGWSGREYPDYKTQWKQLLTPLCEVVIFVDKLHRDSKAVNPGAPGLYLGPAYDNNMELNHYLVQRYDNGKRVRAQYIFANEDRMPLRDGPSPGLVMHHSILELKGTQNGRARTTGPMTAPRMVESKSDMATAQDLSRDTTLTSVVEEDDDDLIVIEPTGSDPVVDQSVGDSVEPGGVVTPVLPEPDLEIGEDDSEHMTAMPDLEPLATAMPSLQSQNDEMPESDPPVYEEPEQKSAPPQGRQVRNNRKPKPAKEPMEEPEAKVIEPVVEGRAIRRAICTNLNP